MTNSHFLQKVGFIEMDRLQYNQMPVQQILKKQTQSSEASDYSKFHLVSLWIRSCYEKWLVLAIGNGSGRVHNPGGIWLFKYWDSERLTVDRKGKIQFKTRHIANSHSYTSQTGFDWEQQRMRRKEAWSYSQGTKLKNTTRRKWKLVLRGYEYRCLTSNCSPDQINFKLKFLIITLP